MGEGRKGYRLQQVLDYLFPVFRAKDVMHLLQAQLALFLSACGQYQKRSNTKSSTASSPSRVCCSLTVLWGSVSADFRPFHREIGWRGGGGWGGGREERGRKVRNRQEK